MTTSDLLTWGRYVGSVEDHEGLGYEHVALDLWTGRKEEAGESMMIPGQADMTE